LLFPARLLHSGWLIGYFLFSDFLKNIFSYLQHFPKPVCQMVRMSNLKTKVMNEILVTAVVFFGIYQILSMIAEFLLKRKLIKAGQYEKVGILENPKPSTDEVNRYPSLKWGLVALMTGLGFILIEVLNVNKMMDYYENAALPIGILLVFISVGFLIYFFIVNGKKK
jgi:hypothetical protein